jgi:hypothetical protein
VVEGTLPALASASAQALWPSAQCRLRSRRDRHRGRARYGPTWQQRLLTLSRLTVAVIRSCARALWRHIVKAWAKRHSCVDSCKTLSWTTTPCPFSVWAAKHQATRPWRSMAAVLMSKVRTHDGRAAASDKPS